MTQYAVVIGIDQYESAKWPPLTLAVKSAVSMAEWLVRPDGGGVDPDNVKLLLSPLPDGKAASARLATVWANGFAKEATSANIVSAVRWPDTVTAHKGGDRLFVYYSGHGVIQPGKLGGQDALVPADWKDGEVDPISTDTVTRYFQSTPFREQYFFFDCCRKLDNRDLVGAVKELLPLDPDPASLMVPDQYIFKATGPGLVTLDAQGMMTDGLLAGLDGVGPAKLWSDDGRYEVQVDRLFRYARARVAATLQGLGATGPEQLQVPRLSGENGDTERAIVGYPDDKFADVTLTLGLAPAGVLPVCQVSLVSASKSYLHKGVPGNPFQVSVRPRTYTATVQTDGAWQPPSKSRDLDIYDHDNWPLLFQAAAGGAMIAAAPPVAASDTKVGLELSKAAPLLPVLTVESADPLVPVELRKADGGPLSGLAEPTLATGRLTFAALPAGTYQARARAADGRTAERLVQVADGQRPDVVRLELPKLPDEPLRDNLAAVINCTRNPDGTIGLSELVPAVAAPSAGTILALASSASTAESAWGDNGQRLRDLKVKPVPGGLRLGFERTAGEPESAFEVQYLARPSDVGGATPDSMEKVATYLQGLTVDVIQLTANGPLDPDAAGTSHRPSATAVAGAVTVSAAEDPGSYRLRLNRADGQLAGLPVVLLADYSAQVQIDQDADGRLRLYRTYPRLTGATVADIARIRAVLDAQRFLHNGGRDAALQLLAPYLQQPFDPAAACLSAGALLAAGRKDEFRKLDLGQLLVNRFPDLPDGYVFKAVREELGDKPDRDVAREQYGRALDRGAPMLARGFELLAGAVGRLKLGHRRAEELVARSPRLVTGLLWTAWAPTPPPRA